MEKRLEDEKQAKKDAAAGKVPVKSIELIKVSVGNTNGTTTPEEVEIPNLPQFHRTIFKRVSV